MEYWLASLEKSNRNLINNYSSFIILSPYTGLWAWAVWVTQSIFSGGGVTQFFVQSGKVTEWIFKGKLGNWETALPQKESETSKFWQNIGRNLGRSSVSMGKITWFAQIFYPNGCILPEFDPPPQRKTYSKNFARFSRWVFPSTCNSGKFFKIFVIFFLPQITIRRVPYAYTPIYRETGIIRYFWDPTLLSFSLWPKDI